MNENPRSNDIVDTTDCFEAISVFKSAKNFLFALILISLLVIQAAFWLAETGYVNEQTDANSLRQVLQVALADTEADPLSQPENQQTEAGEVLKDTPEDIESQAQQVGKDILPQSVQENEAEEDYRNGVEDEPDIYAESDESAGAEIPKLQKEKIVTAIRVANFVLLFASTIYCLVLLIGVNISIAGRMGGMSHICRAFLHSLFFLVILIPWQVFLPGILVGAVYLPNELFAGWQIDADSTTVLKALYYLRFVGLWVLVLILLLNAQIRSGRWSKTILRRLGIIQ